MVLNLILVHLTAAIAVTILFLIQAGIQNTIAVDSSQFPTRDMNNSDNNTRWTVEDLSKNATVGVNK